MDNIIFVGFMGTGKTTVGQALAKRLSRTLVDVDAKIVEYTGKDIPTIFQESGETYFRDTESAVLQRILQESGQVVTTGGGAVLRPENVSVMKANGIVVALHATEEEIVNRVSLDTGRPLLAGDVAERVRTLMEARRGAYDFADVHIDTTGKHVDEIVEEIVAAMVENDRFRRN